ncbi:unnamed protein product [Scytosiphon promiscuus]
MCRRCCCRGGWKKEVLKGFLGASGVIPLKIHSSLGGRTSSTTPTRYEDLVVGGEEHLSAPLTSDEISQRTWHAIQRERRDVEVVSEKSQVINKDETPLIDQNNKVVSGQLEPGLILHACPMTELGMELLRIPKHDHVNVIMSGGVGGGSGSSSAAPSGPVAAEASNPTITSSSSVAPTGEGSGTNSPAADDLCLNWTSTTVNQPKSSVNDCWRKLLAIGQMNN